MNRFTPRTLESKGKTIDEAIFKGMHELGLSIDEVTIETVQEGTKGIFGIGAKPYIIRLTEREADYVLHGQDKASREGQRMRPAKAAAPRRSEKNVGSAAETSRSTPRQETPSQTRQTPDARTQDENGRGYAGERAVESQNRNRGKRESENKYAPYVPGESQCEAAGFLSGLFERMGVDVQLSFFESESTVKIRIQSNSMGIIIGHRGETLDALQYLTSLAVNRSREGYKRVVLDMENYRNKREETLSRLARKMAAQVKQTGESVSLEPMNPYERRVLHASLQNNRDVETHSEGEEPNRHVVIMPKKGGS